MSRKNGEAESTEVDEKATDETEEDESTESLTPEADPDEPVEKPSRRERASAREMRKLEERMNGFTESFERERNEWRQQIQERSRESEYLRGQVETLSRPKEEKPKPIDIDDLQRQADEALDAKDWAKYRRLEAQATEARAERIAERIVGERMGSMRQERPLTQKQVELHSFKVRMDIDYPHINEDPRAFQLAISKDAELAAQGWPDNARRWHKAYQDADVVLKRVNGGTRSPSSNGGGGGYSQRTRGALSGSSVGTDGGNAVSGSDDDDSPLTAEQEKWRKNADMTVKEYRKLMSK